jgi:hypothetical protein
MPLKAINCYVHNKTLPFELMPQDILAFQRSITRELITIKDRVRNIIDNANWAEEGRYKEAILKKVISSFLPGNLSLATGFIVRNDDHFAGQNGVISTQIDLIIYDTSIPVVFREGDFVIVLDTAVRGIIEVKTNIINHGASKNSLSTILTKFNALRVFPTLVPSPANRKIFLGVFSYGYGGNFDADQISTALEISNGFVNHIALGADKFVRFWRSTADLVPPVNHPGPCYLKYNLDNLAFSYFISNLLHIVSDDDPQERYWVFIPDYWHKRNI